MKDLKKYKKKIYINIKRYIKFIIFLLLFFLFLNFFQNANSQIFQTIILLILFQIEIKNGLMIICKNK
jgi:hypothetical protein